MFVAAVGTCIAIADQLPATFDASGYAALSWENVGEVGDTGDWGGEYTQVTWENVCDGVMQKAKGTFDPGEGDMEMAVDPNDAGQQIIKNYYNGTKWRDSAPIRITDPFGTVFYTTAKVRTFTRSASSPNDPYTAAVGLDYDRKFVEVPAQS